MGTPKEAPFSVLSILEDEVTFFPDEIDISVWPILVSKALKSIGPLKEISGFSTVSDYLKVPHASPFPHRTHIGNIVFAPGLAWDSLCREMFVISDSGFETIFKNPKGARKLSKLFLFKREGFVLFSGEYELETEFDARKALMWNSLGGEFAPLSVEGLVSLAENKTEPAKFWMKLFLEIHALAQEDHEKKKERAARAEETFSVIHRMKTRILFPEVL